VRGYVLPTVSWRAAAIAALNERRESGTLWERWAAERSSTVREALVQNYANLARTLAAKAYAGRIEAGVEFDDYLQFAYIGLLEAIDRYEPERGIRFESFATLRVRGSIADGVESLCERHRQVAARQRIIKERTKAFADELGQASGVEAIAAVAEIAVGLAIGFLLEDSGMFVKPDDETAIPDSAYRSVELEQMRRIVQRLVKNLDGNERRVITMHYLHETPFGAIAEELQLSKGRISQLHRSALTSLRKALAEYMSPQTLEL
jgi:RNA polymerase sigma factor for flagellar operon FliA